jgi:hypothetical protein
MKAVFITSDNKKFEGPNAEKEAKAHEATLVESKRDKTTFKYGEVMAVLTDSKMRDGFKLAIDHYLANAPEKPKAPRKPRKPKADAAPVDGQAPAAPAIPPATPESVLG